MKWVRMPPLSAAPVGVVFLVRGDGGAALTPLFPGGTSDLEEVTIDGGVCGRRNPHWRR